jgi:hypothetical protein
MQVSPIGFAAARAIVQNPFGASSLEFGFTISFVTIFFELFTR